jgi:hypothetical protein
MSDKERRYIMADHGGQPQFPGWQVFDVTSLEVTAAPGFAPLNIVNAGAAFTLTATFTGTGANWGFLEGLGNIRYRAQFFAERIGTGAVNIPLVPATDEGALVPGTGTYTINHVVPAGTLTEGVYRIGVIVTFPPMPLALPPSPGVPGTLGYYEGLIVQASTMG